MQFIVRDIDKEGEKLLSFDKISADILFVTLGAPYQEKFMVSNLKRMPSVKLAIGVGGAFDFISGRIRRASKIVRLVGLEWFWRLVICPWRIGRIFRAVIVFPWLVVRSRVKRGRFKLI